MTRDRSTNVDAGYSTYPWQGRQLISVTSLRKVIGTPFNLVQWIVGQTIDAAIIAGNEGVWPFPSLGSAPDGEDVDLGGPVFDLDEFKALRRDAKSEDKKVADKAKRKLTEYRRPIRAAADTERDEAADLGKRVHKAAEVRQTIAEAEPEVRPFLRQFYAAERALDMETLLSEAQVFNLTHGYAGTLDILGRVDVPTPGMGQATIPDGALVRDVVPTERMTAIIDLKTGKDVYVDHLLQQLFYAYGEFVGEQDVVQEWSTARLHETQGVAILHLRPDHWELYDLRPPEDTAEVIFGLARVANWYHGNQSVDPFINSRVRGEA